MDILRKSLFWLFVILVAGYMALKFFLYFQVKRDVDNLAASFRPVASVRYQGISTGLFSGRVAVENLRIEPNGIPDVIRVRVVELKTPDIWFLLRGPARRVQQQLPESLRLTLRGLEISVDGAIMRAMDRATQEMLNAHSITRERGCLGVSFLRPDDYKKMGYEQWHIDLVLGYEFLGSRMQIYGESTTRDLGQLNLNAEINNVSRSLPELALREPYLALLSVVYKDTSFIQRLKRLCAELGGMSEAQFVDMEVNRRDELYRLDWGFVPGPGLKAAYRQFLAQPGELRIYIRPSATLDWTSLAYYKSEDIAHVLNAGVSVNGQPVNDLSFTYTPRERPQSALASASATAPAPATPAPPSVYRRVRIKDLHQYVGRNVRIEQAGDKLREGVLIQAQYGIAIVERRYADGKTTVEVPIRLIEKVEVLD